MNDGISFDRFPGDITEEQVECAVCRQATSEGDSLYDDYKGNSFCGEACFYDWASDHFDVISGYYFERNVGY